VVLVGLANDKQGRLVPGHKVSDHAGEQGGRYFHGCRRVQAISQQAQGVGHIGLLDPPPFG
jgi:hypothetical protein